MTTWNFQRVVLGARRLFILLVTSVAVRLTTAHHLQGAARLKEPTRRRPVVPACTNRPAAPWLVHAPVRLHASSIQAQHTWTHRIGLRVIQLNGVALVNRAHELDRGAPLDR